MNKGGVLHGMNLAINTINKQKENWKIHKSVYLNNTLLNQGMKEKSQER
jgi:hypothetical protein